MKLKYIYYYKYNFKSPQYLTKYKFGYLKIINFLHNLKIYRLKLYYKISYKYCYKIYQVYLMNSKNNILDYY